MRIAPRITSLYTPSCRVVINLEKSAGMECEPSDDDGDYKCPSHQAQNYPLVNMKPLPWTIADFLDNVTDEHNPKEQTSQNDDQPSQHCPETISDLPRNNCETYGDSAECLRVAHGYISIRDHIMLLV